MILKVVDEISDGRVSAVLEQPELCPLARAREVPLQGRSARVKHTTGGKSRSKGKKQGKG